jgi:hypothetical protein
MDAKAIKNGCGKIYGLFSVHLYFRLPRVIYALKSTELTLFRCKSKILRPELFRPLRK